MASAAPIGKALEEAICSICLDYLTEPVTIDCGHNFCRACITQYCEQRGTGSRTKFPCPQCRAPFQKGTFQPNRQLANIVENITQVRLKPEKAQKKNLCEIHGEKLQLFCEEDGETICMVCRESRAHRTHAVFPVEEAVQDYKVKLREALGPLRKELQETLELTLKEKAISMEWQEKVENQRWLITHEFKKLHLFLSEEEQLLQQRLAEEERVAVQRLQANITTLSKQSSALQRLITEVEEKCRQPAAELLKDVKSTLSRSNNMKLQKPESISPALKNVYKICLDMREMLERFTMDVTLDPETANPWLVLSEDQKSVKPRIRKQCLPNSPERFDTMPSVLGAEGLTGGRYYWEVEVGDKIYWILGVCRESVSRKGEVRASPANGYWAMRLWDGKYEACTWPSISLPVSVRPSRVGIFLDYGGGEVSFYNVTDRSHLFTFTDTFSGMLRPYFYPGYNAGGKNAAPLIICSVPDQTRGNLCPIQ
ncbi:E3 ubiquitin-protein ligase TRIM39-like [Emydura macquarii macquarii]|uniref:E3 ubiquitin-protein ligase TRIM39-like n=1 Tax=Emydura macquarii macquarii TaxID=1129001 RepID=UPI00352B0F8D